MLHCLKYYKTLCWVSHMENVSVCYSNKWTEVILARKTWYDNVINLKLLDAAYWPSFHLAMLCVFTWKAFCTFLPPVVMRENVSELYSSMFSKRLPQFQTFSRSGSSRARARPLLSITEDAATSRGVEPRMASEATHTHAERHIFHLFCTKQ